MTSAMILAIWLVATPPPPPPTTTTPPTPTPTTTPTTTAVGEVSLPVGDMVVRFQPLALLQIDGRSLIHNDGLAVEGNDGFVVPRARLGGRMSAGHMTLQVVMEGARDKPGVLEAFGTVRLGDADNVLDVIAGLARSPLLLGGLDPLVLMPLNERSALERTMWPGRELGVGVYVAPSSLPLEVWARVTNGNVNALLGNDNAGLAADARIDLAWGAARRRARPDGPGLRLGLSSRAEDTDDEAGRAGTTPLGFPYWLPPLVSGPAVLVGAHVVGVLGPARLALQGAVMCESRAIDDDDNPDTAKRPRSGVVHGGGSAELSTTVWGPARSAGRPLSSNQAAAISVEVAARIERVWLGLTPPGERADRLLQPGGATIGSASVTTWLSSWTSLSAQAWLANYDTAPLQDPGRTMSAIIQLRWTVVVM